MLALLLAPALAAQPSFVRSVGEQIDLPVTGLFARVLDAGDGSWHFFWGAGRDYWVAPMGADYSLDEPNRTNLTNLDLFQDHAVTRCPDGTLLHAASASLENDNDTTYLFRYDADFAILDQEIPVTGETEREANDMALICTDAARGFTMTGNERGAGPAWFLRVDEELEVQQQGFFPPWSRMMGGTFLDDPEAGRAFTIGQEGAHGHKLRIAAFDRALETELETWEIEPPDDSERWFWPQDALRVGAHYLVVHMGLEASQGWDLELADGDVYLHIFDLNWQPVQKLRLSNNPPGDGGMRPAMVLRDSLLLISYDRALQPRLIEVELDLDALAIGPVDTGGADTARPEDTAVQDTAPSDTAGPSDTGGDTDKANNENGSTPPPRDPGCGCDTGPATGAAAAVLLGLFGAGRRRRGLPANDGEATASSDSTRA